MATVRLQLRRGTDAQWDAANPTLAAGEIGIETDTNTFKFGDGSTPWNSLSYALSETVDDYILLSTKGVANGVASLDSSGFVPSAQLPPLAKVTVSAVANQAARLALTAESGDIAIQADNGQSYVLSASPASTDGNWKALVGSEAVVDTVEASLIAGTGLDKTYNDSDGTITIDIDSTVATKTYADQSETDAIATAAADATSKANAAEAAAATTAAAAVAAHEADTTNVHGITDTSLVVTTTAAQTLVAKSLTSPTLTGTPIAPTATAGTDTTQIATTAFVQDAIELVVGAAPAALNTLAEIATSLADNADLSGTLTTSISNKVSKAGDTMSGALNMGTNKITDLGVPTLNTDASTKAYADGIMVNGINAHAIVTTGIHGITDAANLVYTADTRLSDSRVPENSSVTTAKIVDLNVTSAKINDSAVTAEKIATSAVTTDKILDLNVTSVKIATSAVETAKIADDAVSAAKIANDAVTAAKITNDAVTEAKIANNAVTAEKIATGAVGTSEIADDAVTAAKIATGAVGTSEIADDAVTAAKIAADAVSTSEIADDAVTAAKIATGAVGNSEIADGSITTGKINNSAVTEEKIAALAVTEGKIADSAVTTVKIADSAITTGKIANGAIIDADVNASAEIAQSKIASLTTDLAAKLASATAASTYAPLASPTFTGTVNIGHVLPTTDNTFDLGSAAKMWRDIYVGPGSLYVNGQKVLQDESGAIVVSADVDENLGLRTSGSGNIELDPTGTGSVNIKGPLVVEAGANFSSADGNGITFSNGLNSDTLASKTLNTDLSLSGNGTGKVYLNDNAEVNGNLVVTGNFTVSGTTTSVNTETISLADNIIDLNSNFTTGSPTENSGIRVMRGDSNAVQIRWNESTDKWESTTDGTNYSVIAGLDSPTFTGTVTIPAGASISGFAPLASPTFTGTVTVAAAGVAFTDGTQTKVGVPSVTTIATTLAAGARTLAAGEQDKFVPLSGAVVITLPSSGYSTGQSIDFYQESGTGSSFASTNSVVGTPGLKFRTTNSVATALKTAAGWLVFGDLSA